MKPAGRLLGVLIRANRLDAGAPILSERLPEAIADIGVASAGKFIEPDRTQEPLLKLVAPAACLTKSMPPRRLHSSPSLQKTSRPFAPIAVLDRFAAAGMTAVDTADVYSSWCPATSEANPR